MKYALMIAAILGGSAVSAGAVLGVFGATGECTVICKGTRPQDNWSNEYGPFTGKTQQQCEQEARNATVPDVSCDYRFSGK